MLCAPEYLHGGGGFRTREVEHAHGRNTRRRAAGTAIAPIAAGRPVAVPRPGRGRHRAGGDALALGERIDLSDENHLLGLFAALLAVFAVSTCGLVLGLAGLLRRSRKRHLALAGIVLNLSCLLWGWHALSTAAAAILMVLGQTGLSFLSALAVLFGMIFFRQA